ncbi:hypothetical protein [Ralstonia phage RP12]|uniref:Uncharacterized protein n=1 Tax=Ralstonia phage RP12 TaxID=1923889 RepID=A0A1L7N192_9CAUD|nr:hypothetical protein FDH28_gp142 [Ralstonia phage RP12]BAW19253.1 hypothetical protein [Ralstonia phage RP12]
MKIKVVSQADLALPSAERTTDDIYGGALESGKAKSKRYMIIEHGNAKLQWNFPPRTWNSEPDTNADAFDQINAYFEQLDGTKQAAIFEEYRQIHTVLRATNMQQDECEDLIEAIRPMAKALFDQIDPTHFYNWVWSTLRPRVPVDVKITFDPDTMPGTRERTYLLEDYKGLIPLAILVRAAVPFWFDFAALTKSVLSREHKDMLAYSLIEQAWPAQCQALKRLEQFVDHTIGNDRNNPAAIMMGIGTDDFVYWALTSLVINRLPVVDVMGVNNLTPVVSALYNYVRHRVTTIASSQPAIKNKFAETSYSADENNQSYLEGFRNRIALTVGQEALGDYYLEQQIELIHKGVVDPLSLIERVAPGIDYALVEDSLNSAKALHGIPLMDEQITIAAWLFHPYSQVRAVGNLLKERVVSLLGLAQAVLIHHGKIDLAMLVSAAYERVDNSGGTHFIGESIAPLRAVDREAYRAVFPMEQRSRNQKKVRNFVFDDVYELVRSLQEYDINCTFSDATLQRVQGNNPNRKYFLRRDAVTMFMEYAKWLAERPMVRINPDEVYQQLMAQATGTHFAPFKFH